MEKETWYESLSIYYQIKLNCNNVNIINEDGDKLFMSDLVFARIAELNSIWTLERST